MSERVTVGPVDELGPGDRTLVTVDGREIGVINYDDEYYALDNYCPHRGGPLCEGEVQGTVVADWPGIGERVVERVADEPAVACPWHGWEYDLATGDHLGDDTVSIRTYDITVEDDIVYIDL